MKTNSEFTYVILYILLFFILILILIVIFIIQSRKKILKKELEKKELEILFQKEVLQATILSQEKERSRIAQDLHDEISSKLIAVSLNLHLLNSKKTPEIDKEEIINNIITINNNSIENSRRIAHDLLPPVLEKFGLNEAFKELVNDYSNSKQIKFYYTNSVDFHLFNSKYQLQIFRIIQEAINNSIKHGKATTITIQFEKNQSSFQCKYSDDGIGFDSNNLNVVKGLGLNNIESRVNYINGKYSFVSSLSKGFQFQFTFNL